MPNFINTEKFKNETILYQHKTPRTLWVITTENEHRYTLWKITGKDNSKIEKITTSKELGKINDLVKNK